MKKALLLFVTLIIALELCAQNQMQLIQTITSNTPNSYFGDWLSTPDFNGDGIDDLVAQEKGGRSYVYFGGSTFDSVPDLIKWSRSRYAMLAVGDVNGDGYDDLLSAENYPDSTSQFQVIFQFYYGGPNPDLIPDHEIIVPAGMAGPFIQPLEPLGDINNDGYDDIGCKWYHVDNDSLDLAVMLGGSFQMVTVVPDISTSGTCSITGIGDVNYDSFPDFMVGYARDDIGHPRRRFVYYGDNGLNLTNRVMMLETTDVNATNTGGYGIGDFDGDGFDDMIVADPPSVRTYTVKFKLGSLTLPESQEYEVTGSDILPPLLYFGFNKYGDFNGDGYSDVVGTNLEAYVWEGIAGVWLGRANPNGLYDLALFSPDIAPYHQFGNSVSTGDYNNDGYCDIAISAPNSSSGDPFFPGYVFIYAGNAGLEDTTLVGTEDATQVPETNPIKLRIYPNPIRKGQLKLEYVVEGKLPKDIKTATITMHNIKGQVIGRYILNLKHIKRGKGEFTLNNINAGIYVTSLMIDNKRITTTKLTIK